MSNKGHRLQYTYIALSREEYRAAKVEAMRRGVSFAEYLARLVRADLTANSNLPEKEATAARLEARS